MAARPTTRRASHEPSAPRSDAPGHPQVRDFATPSTAYAIEWDVRSVYDFLFSLTDDAGSTDDLPEPDRTWLTESRASLPAETRRDLDEARLPLALPGADAASSPQDR